jgi:hypothetical protein
LRLAAAAGIVVASCNDHIDVVREHADVRLGARDLWGEARDPDVVAGSKAFGGRRAGLRFAAAEVLVGNEPRVLFFEHQGVAAAGVFGHFERVGMSLAPQDAEPQGNADLVVIRLPGSEHAHVLIGADQLFERTARNDVGTGELLFNAGPPLAGSRWADRREQKERQDERNEESKAHKGLLSPIDCVYCSDSRTRISPSPFGRD